MADLEPQNTTDIVDESSTVVTVVEKPRRPRKVYAGMWGPLEIGAVAVSALTLLASLLLYFLFVLPSGRELARNKSESDRLEVEVTSAQTKYGEITNTQDQVTKLVTSVDDFETRFLPAMSNGQTALYQRLNGLIQAYNLVNTSGPDYVPLQIADQNNGQQQESDEQKGRAKFRSLYPGVYVTTNVEGTYQNLRRFIRDIETGNEFIVIGAIELAPSDNTAKKEAENAKTANPANPVSPAATNPGMPPGGPGVRPQPGLPNGFSQPQVNPYGSASQIKPKPGKTHGDLLSLHIELAAYFRRPNFAPTGVVAQ